MAAFAVAMGVMSAASALADGSERNEGMRRKAREYGMQDAAVNFSARRYTNMLVTQAEALSRDKFYADQAIEDGQAEAEAQARVNAAVTGVSGDSVTDVINDTEANAVKAKAQVDREKAGSERQLLVNQVDNVINADLKKGILDTTHDKRRTAVETGLGFLQGYASGLSI